MWVIVIGDGCFSRKLVEPRWGEAGDLELERDGWSHCVLGVFFDEERERETEVRRKELWILISNKVTNIIYNSCVAAKWKSQIAIMAHKIIKYLQTFSLLYY